MESDDEASGFGLSGAGSNRHRIQGLQMIMGGQPVDGDFSAKHSMNLQPLGFGAAAIDPAKMSEILKEKAHTAKVQKSTTRPRISKLPPPEKSILSKHEEQEREESDDEDNSDDEE